MAITEDASTPAVATGTGTGNLSCASFSPPAGTLLVALVAAGFANTPDDPGITLSDSVGGSWTAGPTVRSTVTNWFGRVSIFYRYLAAAPGSMTVTAAYTLLAGGRFLAVRVLNGAASSQAGAGSATRDITTATTAWTTSITTTQAGSQVYGICDDPVNNDVITAAAATTLVGAAFVNTTDAQSTAAGKATAVTGTPGATTLGFTNAASQNGCLALLEILPASVVASPGTDPSAWPWPGEGPDIPSRSFWMSPLEPPSKSAAFQELFERGSHGAGLSTANTSFAAVIGSPTFDSGVFAEGTLGAKWPGGSTQSVEEDFYATRWRYWRRYLRIEAAPDVATIIQNVRYGAAACAQVRINVDRTVSLRNALVAVATSTSTLTAGQFFRYEYQVNADTQTQTLRLFLGANISGTTPDETISGAYTQGYFDNSLAGEITSATLVMYEDGYGSDPDTYPAPLTLAAGGTTWDPGLQTDSAGLTDTAAIERTAVVTDSAGLTDTASVTRAPEVTDSAGLTDTVAATLAPVVTDSAGLTDTATALKTTELAATDSAGLTDLVGKTVAQVVTDSAGLTDTVSGGLAPLVTDSAGLTDTATVEKVALVAQTDSAGLTDTAAATISQSVTDSAGLTDPVAATRSNLVTDSAGLTDSAVIETGKLVAQTDSAGLTDSVAVSRSSTVTDSAGLTDTVSATRSTVVTDSAGLTDTATVAPSKLLTQTDSAGLTDSATTTRGLVLTDDAGLTDSLLSRRSLSYVDDAGLTDTAEIVTAGTEAPGFADSQDTPASGMTRSADRTATLTTSDRPAGAGSTTDRPVGGMTSTDRGAEGS